MMQKEPDEDISENIWPLRRINDNIVVGMIVA